jgi:hypothetical protein
MGVHLLHTFFSCSIQLLWWQKTKMWMYPESSCHDRPSSKEMSMAEVNSRIHKVLDLGTDSNPEAGPAPLLEGVASARVSMFGPISAAYEILSFHRPRMRPGGRRDMPSMRKCGLRKRGNELGGGGGHTPHRSRSFGEGEEEGEITLPPLSYPHITPPPLGDIVYRQVWTTVNDRRLKRTKTGTKPLTDSPRRPRLT